MCLGSYNFREARGDRQRYNGFKFKRPLRDSDSSLLLLARLLPQTHGYVQVAFLNKMYVCTGTTQDIDVRGNRFFEEFYACTVTSQNAQICGCRLFEKLYVCTVAPRNILM